MDEPFFLRKQLMHKKIVVNHLRPKSPKISRLSEIKLIRTDTTLDLSQKAEKVWIYFEHQLYLYNKKKFQKHGERKTEGKKVHPQLGPERKVQHQNQHHFQL